jgi:hypothetical protein
MATASPGCNLAGETGVVVTLEMEYRWPKPDVIANNRQTVVKSVFIQGE